MPDLTIGFDPIEHDQPAGDYAAVLAKLPAVFAACCGANTARFDLSGPWMAYGYAYASDTRIIVRMPVAATLAAKINAARPKAARAPSNGPKVLAGRWVSDPIEPPAHDPAHECKGCHGRERVACECCLGSRIDPLATCQVGGATLAADLVRTIREAGGVLYPSRRRAHRSPVRWVVPGTLIEGVVMPMTD